MSDFSEAQSRLTETSYKTEAWHYRHAVVNGLIFFFSLFYLAARCILGALGGGISAIIHGWTDTVRPFMRTLNETPHTTASIPGAPDGPANAAGIVSPKRYN